MEVEGYQPYKPFFDPNDYENYAIILLVIGFCLMSYFFMYYIYHKLFICKNKFEFIFKYLFNYFYFKKNIIKLPNYI